MKIGSLKPFDKGNYLSEEESLKLIEKIPIPKDDTKSTNPVKPKLNIPEANNPISDDNPFVDLEGRLMDLNPADNGNCKTQDEWITYFNARNEIMVSMPDLYFAAKSRNLALLDSLNNENNRGKCIITSTRIIYEDKTNTKIIHYYGSNVIKPVEYKIVIPEYIQELLINAPGTKIGLDHLQKLFETEDNAEQIIETLQKLGRCRLEEIHVEPQPCSASKTDYVCGFWHGFGEFNFIIGDMTLDEIGISYGMRIITPGAFQTTGGVK